MNQDRVLNYFTTSRTSFPIILAASVGALTAILAVGFIHSIHWIEVLFFQKGKLILNALGPYYVILIPVLGGLIVGPLIVTFAPEAKGHGVPEVLKAIAVRGGKIRPIVVVIKAIASALSIGTGASVGREGPIVQVGSALGSSLAQFFRFNEMRTRNLIACGAAAGISAVFNAPIAGVMFSLEVILKDFGTRALSTVVVAAVAASVISRMFLGESPAFLVPDYALWSPYEIFLYAGLGIASALAAQFFITVLHFFEDVFDHWKFPNWLKPACGGILVGTIGVYFPHIFGSGLHPIEEALHGNLALTTLGLLIFLKTLATSISLGAGSSGGVFAPALFIGAVLGGAYGKVFLNHMPFPVAPSGAYALVGMASVFAAAAHAPVSAILIVFEMTGDYRMILPIMISVVLATLISQRIREDSIYTIRLRQSGVHFGYLGEARVFGMIRVQDAMSQDFTIVPGHLSAKELIEQFSLRRDHVFFVTGKGHEVLGLIKREDMQELLLEGPLESIRAVDLVTRFSEYCFSEDPLDEVARLMTARGITELPVVEREQHSRIAGILKSEHIFRAYSEMSLKHSELVSRLEKEATADSETTQITFLISPNSLLAQKAVKNIAFPDGVILASIKRGTKIIIPHGNTVLHPKDKIKAQVTPAQVSAFKEWLTDQK